MIGYMQMPADFIYKDVFLKGKPVHQRFDRFRLRHPSMDCGRRAKIFAPFDALAGFNEAVAAKEVLYEFRRELDDGEKEELNRKLVVLHSMTYNSRAAEKNKVPVTVTYYVPCADKNSLSYGCRGQYVKLSGICRYVGLRSITVDKTVILFDDILEITSTKTVKGQNIFETWEDYAS